MTRNSLPLQLSESSGVPFYRQVVDQVADLVRSGQLPPGSRLPSVRSLSGDLLVSLITVRRAYEELENAGLLERRQGQGTFVADSVDAPGVEMLDDARQALVAAVERAHLLGLSAEAIVGVVEEALAAQQQTISGADAPSI